ncbi:MAG: DNA primase [Pseudomonadota bacterium]
MQQRIPPGFIQDLLARADIVEVVGQHVELKKTGSNYKGLCPFHGEKTPSFTVSASKQFYHCFGCGAHGTAIGFLMEHAGMGFVDAVKELAARYGMTVPEPDLDPQQLRQLQQQRSLHATLVDVLQTADAFYQHRLRHSDRAKNYLITRGLQGAIAKRFGLGYAPDDWQPLAGAFANYQADALVQSGLVVARDTAGDTLDPQAESFASAQRRYDRLRDRITFPIRNQRGEVIGFGGRIIDQGEPKYLNSPETAVFHKGEELYGLFEARTAISRVGYALVVEGYMDVVALAQFGVENAVATLGTACTAQQLQKLFRHTGQVVFSFDGDAAGRRAARRAMEQALPLLSDSRVVKFLFLPAEHDPDSYVRERGAEAFEREVARAQPLSEFLFASLFDGVAMATAEGRAQAIHEAAPLFSQITAPALLGQLIADFARQLGMPATELREVLRLSAPVRKPTTPAASFGGQAGNPQRRGRSGREALRAFAVVPKDPLRQLLPLLLAQPSLWWDISPAQHGLLSHEPGPLQPLALALESILENQPDLSAAALWEELRAAGHSPEEVLAQSPDPLELDEAVARQDLQAILLRLERSALLRRQDELVVHGLVADADRAEYRSLAIRLKEIDHAQRG